MIKEAAIIFRGILYTGKRHNNIFSKIIAACNIERVTTEESIQGFVTNEGKFVDRKEGAKIALESGQIEKLNWPPDLYSEDLY